MAAGSYQGTIANPSAPSTPLSSPGHTGKVPLVHSCIQYSMPGCLGSGNLAMNKAPEIEGGAWAQGILGLVPTPLLGRAGSCYLVAGLSGF